MIDLHFPIEGERLSQGRRTSFLTELKSKNPAELIRIAIEAKPGSPSALRGTSI